MKAETNPMRRLAALLHQHLIWLLLAAYALAALAPAVGLWVRSQRFGTLTVLGQPTTVSLPSLLLALLLVNAGLGVQTDRLGGLARRPIGLLLGLLANLAVPLLFILTVSLTLRFWHNADEVQSILVGLALIASMPVAGSSTAWSQNSGGDLALSLGLVVLSTCLSPLTTPAVLHATGWMANGIYAGYLHDLAANQTGGFLLLWVLLPSLLGMSIRFLLGERGWQASKPCLKCCNTLILLLLCYSNAAAALPQTVANPDWDFLAVMLAIVVSLCVLAFTSGWLVARLVKADQAAETALMFGLGMNNNGTGLVLASTALAGLPEVLLPVIFYNLVQHLVAGATDRLRPRGPHAEPAQAAPTPLLARAY
jgi:BASS family bile acid:Na+ symporter